VKSIVIIGTGLAGYNLAKEFRKLNTEIPLHLITSDDGRFYYKPMLSSALTNGKTPGTLVTASAEQMSEQLNATIQSDSIVTAINIDAQHVIVDGDIVSYGKLILALGAAPIHLPMYGDAASEILFVNNLNDYSRFRRAIVKAMHVAIIGPGLIGCEFANDLINAGKHVTVIGPDAAPLGRLLPSEAGAVLRDALAGIGIEWRLGVVADEMIFNNNCYRLRLSDGTYIDADVVLSAVGLRPNIQLAKQAGLKINRGIVVDRMLETSATGVYALGDCMEVEGLVLPFVMPIMHCARALAKTLAGNPTKLHYPAMPVVVKTPAHPVIVSPPPVNVAGHWQITRLNGGVRAEFRDGNNQLQGFALTGSATADQQMLTKELPPLLP